MEHGLGITEHLRRVAQRSAQAALRHYLDHHVFEFIASAGTAVEFLAKAIIALHDPAHVFETPEELTDGERRVLEAPSSERPPPLFNDLIKARGSLAGKKTIRATDAFKVAANLLEHRDHTLDPSTATRLWNARNAALHLGDVPIEPPNDLAAIFVPLAEQLWMALGREGPELWGYLTSAAVAVGKNLDYASWDATRRIIRAQGRASELGPVTMNRRTRLVGQEVNATCPACRGPAHISSAPPGSAPEGIIAPEHANDRVFVLDCLICTLTLFGEHQLRAAGIPS